MSESLDLFAKTFDPKAIEKKWYTYWEEGGFFRGNAHSQKPAYTIVLPPPNVTGVLHVGHALGFVVQDILIRFKRMSGFEALWLPGTDHAGIATQTVVERYLLSTTGKRRTDFSREEFLEHIWHWKEIHEKQIVAQMKSQGASCDWSRMRFTMDAGCSRAVRVLFKKLFDEGLIYRGDYLVNWDPVTQTALADDEVEYEERNSFLWHFAYPLSDGSGFIPIATQRPEMLFGDTAVAVAPNDERYQQFVGKTVHLPLTNRHIPVIIDDHIDPSFGTGAMKVTPAHDPNDYQIGLRHNLPMINIMTADGKMNHHGGALQGISLEAARLQTVQAMQQAGFLLKTVPYVTRVGISYRSKATIEPHLSKQWFVRMTAFKEQLIDAVASGKTKLIPDHWKSTYFHWIENLRDWCISRQLVWGHQIPIWYHKKAQDVILCYDGVGVPEEVKRAPDDWVQDSDVLDTWFSSALWPFSTMGWPSESSQESPDLQKFYPNSTLVTGHDILFFWVARMLMMGEYALNQLPFPQVFLMGLIYGKSYWRQNAGGGIHYVSDQERKAYDLGAKVPDDVESRWEKMSKSKGNVIDPNEIIEEYGADAMRLALASCITNARHIDLDRRRFEEYRHFANKIWNGARFVFMNLTLPNASLSREAFGSGIVLPSLDIEDAWILARSNVCIEMVTQYLEGYSFDKATECIYNFFWNEFCAYYVEIVKPVLFGKAGTPETRENKQKILLIVLLRIVRLMHPIAPFITEELFQLCKKWFGDAVAGMRVDGYTREAIAALQAPACIVAPFPKAEKDNFETQVAQFELLSKVVYAYRNIRGEMAIPPTVATDAYLYDPRENIEGISQRMQQSQHIITSLVKTNSLIFAPPPATMGSSAVVEGISLFIPMPEALMEQEKQRLAKEEKKITEAIAKIEAQLANENFIAKAPPELITKQRAALEEARQALEKIRVCL